MSVAEDSWASITAEDLSKKKKTNKSAAVAFIGVSLCGLVKTKRGPVFARRDVSFFILQASRSIALSNGCVNNDRLLPTILRRSRNAPFPGWRSNPLRFSNPRGLQNTANGRAVSLLTQVS